MFEGIRRHIEVWRESWRAENERPKVKRGADERAFLPAAIEIMETPASPAGRAVMVTVALFFAAALAWAFLGEIDIVATAQGKIITHSRTKVVQPAEMGVVRAIHVQDGKRVKKGDLLVSLDPTESAADLERITRELLASRIDVARLTALRTAADPLSAFVPPEGATPAMVHTQKDLMASTLAEHVAKMAVQENELARRQAEYRVIETTVQKYKNQVPLIGEQVEIRQYLTDNGLASKLLLLDLKERQVEAKNGLITETAKLHEVTAAVAGIHRQMEQIKQEYRKTLLTDLAAAEIKASGLEQELKKATQRSDLQDLIAPVDGVVAQLAIHTVGGVVKPAEAVMAIVPMDEQLEVEAQVLNKDIGFVEVGQPAEVKLETFPFTRYGIIAGTVIDVSSDAVQDEKLGFIYPTRVALARGTMEVNGKTVNLAPGMTATVEIKTGTRRAIEFILAPLLRYGQESLRER
jgi:hemolysin D